LSCPDLSAFLPEQEVWLAKLKSIAAQGNWAAASVGLDRWQKMAAQTQKDLQACLARAAEALESFQDLSGKFRALQVKGAAIAQRQPIPELQRLEARCVEELARKPCDLTEARRLVEAYEKVLVGKSNLSYSVSR
jgi:hypothetical protein